jgi:hypothetical protein
MTKKPSHPKKVKQLAALNGTYHIRFADRNADQGFAILMQGGKFHCLPEEDYIVSARHRELLDAVNVPYEVVEMH